MRGDALDHVLFAGPPASARRLWRRSWLRNWASASGHFWQVISKAGDLAALLTNLEERDVLFIDEIDR